MDIFDFKEKNQIITLGVQLSRGDFDTSICSYGFLFRKFDYCGNIIKEKVYNHFGSLVFWNSIFTGIDHNADYSRSGYNITHRNNKSYFMGSAANSSGEQNYNVLLILDEQGEVELQKIYSKQMIDGQVEHLVLFDDGRILATSYSLTLDAYTLNWIDADGSIRKQIKVDIENNIGLYYAKETQDGQLCFTGIKNSFQDNNSIYVFKIDTFGNLNWTYEFHGLIGYARDMFLKDSSLIICASVDDTLNSKRSLELIELNNKGNEISTKTIDVPNYSIEAYCGISMIDGADDKYYVAMNLTPVNKSQRTISIVSLTQDLNLNWFKYFYKKDTFSFGNKMTVCSDGGLAIIGEARHQRPTQFGSVIIKTTMESPLSNISIVDDGEFYIFPNPIQNYLYYLNESHSSFRYIIYSTEGVIIDSGIDTQGKVSVEKLRQGIYFIKFINSYGKAKSTKFIKM